MAGLASREGVEVAGMEAVTHHDWKWTIDVDLWGVVHGGVYEAGHRAPQYRAEACAAAG